MVKQNINSPIQHTSYIPLKSHEKIFNVAPNQIRKFIIQNGVTLEKSYVQPICTPSRSSLMTGMDPYLIGRQGYPISHKQPTGLTLGL
jgi:arylsulfatase A-like enzyme